MWRPGVSAARSRPDPVSVSAEHAMPVATAPLELAIPWTGGAIEMQVLHLRELCQLP